MYFPIIGGCLGVCEALLIQQVHFRCKSSGHSIDGQLWMWNSQSEWAEELCMSVSTIKRAIYHLEGIGVLVSGVFNKHKYDKTKWFRVDYKVLEELLRKQYPKQPEIVVDTMLKMNQPPVQNGPDQWSKKSQPIPESSSEITTEIPSGPTGEKQFGKITMKTPVVRAADIVKDKGWELKKNAGKAKAATKPVKSTPTSLIEVWREVVPTLETSAGCVPEFTMAQKGMLGRLAKLWGKESASILRLALTNWIGYTKYVADMAGLYKTPHAPAIPFLVKYANEAVAFYKTNTVHLIAQPSTQPKVKAQTKIIIKKVPPKSDVSKSNPAPKDSPQHDGEGGVASVEDILKYVTL